MTILRTVIVILLLSLLTLVVLVFIIVTTGCYQCLNNNEVHCDGSTASGSLLPLADSASKPSEQKLLGWDLGGPE